MAAHRQAGFTLLEILVVVVIAAIITSMAVLSLPDSGPQTLLEREQARLRASLQSMCDRALLSGSVQGVRFFRQGYDFWHRSESSWQPLAANRRPLTVNWPESLTYRLSVEGHELSAAVPARPQVRCSALEPPTAFRLELRSGRHRLTLSWPE
ncbi:MAG: prepilin-type N-terminal cleavage/methylation domain-containing protein [Xanthomonadaceae bacterium]|nr:prepilin-type N-terminal cleavage/methylation domain-containing protein [Xanthomonadaceae bacterium]